MTDDFTTSAVDLEDSLAEWYAEWSNREVTEPAEVERDSLVASIVSATGKRAVDVRAEAAERGGCIALSTPPSAA